MRAEYTFSSLLRCVHLLMSLQITTARVFALSLDALFLSLRPLLLYCTTSGLSRRSYPSSLLLVSTTWFPLARFLFFFIYDDKMALVLVPHPCLQNSGSLRDNIVRSFCPFSLLYFSFTLSALFILSLHLFFFPPSRQLPSARCLVARRQTATHHSLKHRLTVKGNLSVFNTFFCLFFRSFFLPSSLRSLHFILCNPYFQSVSCALLCQPIHMGHTIAITFFVPSFLIPSFT